MRRQLLATAAAISTTLALAVAVPAFANHEVPELVEATPDNPSGNVSCEDIGLVEIDTIQFGAEGPKTFDIDPADYPGFVITAVIVKASNASNIFDQPPFDHVFGPENKGISHIEVCGEEEVDETETPTPTPTPTPTNGETTTTPPVVVVPTEVPAGANGDGGSGSAGLVGLVIAAGAGAAGFVLFARRRALHDS